MSSPTTPRMIHLGVGNFARAHALWYTQRAGGWPVAVFTGRSARLADALRAQGCRYSLITKGGPSDEIETIGVIAEAHPAADLDALRRLMASPEVEVVTMTITEAGYHERDGRLDPDDADVQYDAEHLADALAGKDADLRTVPARLVVGLAARRANGAGALSLVSCDNLPHNGRVLARVVDDFARQVDSELAGWISENCAFVSTMVDRITPATTDADRAEVRERTGFDDREPVPTEVFSEWVIEDSFAAGRPAWHEVGAVMTDNVEAHENRKLLLLNGAHSVVAYLGLLAGHEMVSDAWGDPAIRAEVAEWWRAARPLVDFDDETLDDYEQALDKRWQNAAIKHRTAQIGADGSLKLGVRVPPVIAHDPANEVPYKLLAAWVTWVRRELKAGRSLSDRREEALAEASDDLGRVLAVVDPSLAAPEVVEQVEALL